MLSRYLIYNTNYMYIKQILSHQPKSETMKINFQSSAWAVKTMASAFDHGKEAVYKFHLVA